jgi:hypothetical protein
MKHKPTCIKCRQKYDSPDPDDYYCEACFKDKKRIADEIDAKFANRPKKKVVSDLQRYDSLADGRGFVRAQDIL